MKTPASPQDVAVSPSCVVLVNDFGWVNGGQSKVAIESALALRDRGLDVVFVAGRGPLDERLLDGGVDCHVVGDHDILSDPNRLRAAASGIWNRKAATVLRAVVRSRDPADTIVHVHGWAKSLSPSIGPVVTEANTAHVYTLHEYFLACPNGGFYDYPAGEICSRRALGPSCLLTNCDQRSYSHKIWRAGRQAVLWSAGKMPRNLSDLIYLSPEQRSIFEPYIQPGTHWHFLPNPIEPTGNDRALAEENKEFLFVGRFSPEKGAVLAAQAARRAGVPIAFCGEGELEDAILEANPAARMLGWLTERDLIAQMRRSRALLFPSLWYETYGLVVAEAMREGLPVLVSDRCVTASLVKESGAGELVPAGDVEAWAAALARMQTEASIQQWSENAYDYAKRLPDPRSSLARLLAIYAKVKARHAVTEHAYLEAIA